MLHHFNKSCAAGERKRNERARKMPGTALHRQHASVCIKIRQRSINVYVLATQETANTDWLWGRELERWKEAEGSISYNLNFEPWKFKRYLNVFKKHTFSLKRSPINGPRHMEVNHVPRPVLTSSTLWKPFPGTFADTSGPWEQSKAREQLYKQSTAPTLPHCFT